MSIQFEKLQINREDFKTEIGKKTYDLIMSFNPPNDDFVMLMLGIAKGDERRKILINFLENECQNIRQLHDFVISKWG